MDGKGRYLDNLFIERLWRTVKYEEVYLKAYESVREARKGIGEYFQFYNIQRPHQALNYRTPLDVFDSIIEEPISSSADERWDPQQRAVVIPGKVGSALTVGNQHKWDRLGPEKIIIMKSCVGAP